MSYLTDTEKETVEWFKAIVAEGGARLQHSRLDQLGVLTVTLPDDFPAASSAWLAYVAAQAAERGAAVRHHDHGVLVMVLPRYVCAKQEHLPL